MKRYFLALLITAVLFCAVSCGESNEFATSRQLREFNADLEEKDYSSAVSLYRELEPEEMTNANKIIANKVSEILDKYFDGTYDYSSAYKAIGAYDVFYISEVVNAKEKLTIDNDFATKLNNAKSYYSAKKYAEALRELDGIDVSYRFYDDASELTDKCISEYRDGIIAQCAALAENNKYQDIYNLIEQSGYVLPGDTELSNLKVTYEIAEDEWAYNTLVSYCDSYAEKNDYISVLSTLQEYASDRNKDITELKNSYIDKWTDYVNGQAEAIGSGGDSKGAADYLDAQSVIFKENGVGWDNSLTNTFYKYYNAYVSETLNSAKGLAEKKKYEEATAQLDNLIEWRLTSDDNNKVQKIRDEYADRCPTWLYDIPCIENTLYDAYFERSTVTDQFGNQYKNGYRMLCSNYSDYYAIFNLNKRFDKFSATVFVTSGNPDNIGNLYIYSDNKLLKSYENMKNSTDPIKITLNTKDISKIKIVTSGTSSLMYAYLYICEPLFSN